MKPNTTFYLGSHKPVNEYGLLAQPLSKAPKVTTHGNYNLVDLNRENIGIDKESKYPTFNLNGMMIIVIFLMFTYISTTTSTFHR